MKKKHNFRKKRAIRKPLWIMPVFAFLIVFSLLGHILWAMTSDSVADSSDLIYSTCKWRDIQTYYDELSVIAEDGITDEELMTYGGSFSLNQASYQFPARITVNGKEICNSFNSMAVYGECCSDDGWTWKGLKFLLKWDPDTTPGAQKLLDYQNMNRRSLFSCYDFLVKDFYIDPDNNLLYIGEVEVFKYSIFALEFATFVPGDASDDTVSFEVNERNDSDASESSDGNPRIVETVDLTPSDKTLLEGFEHIDNNASNGKYYINALAITGSEKNYNHEKEYWLYNEGEKIVVKALYDNSFIIDRHQCFKEAYGWVIFMCSLILSLICGTVLYFRKKTIYEIFEYRRKTTNAMAHDLKTPLAIASLSVANLKENLNVNNERVEYHADEIDESIRYMDRLICNILDFSRSEERGRKIKKTNVSVKEEIEAHKDSIEDVLASRKMTLEINGEAMRNTDRKIWNQAVFNLIDNAVKYGTEGSVIVVDLGEKEIIISNNVDAEIIDPESLLEPFVKGNSDRGENSGSGLGLAIADNNLRALGYKLKVSSENKRFIAKIR